MSLDVKEGEMTICCDGYLCEKKELHDFILIDIPDECGMDFCSLKCLKRWLDYQVDPQNRTLQAPWWDGET